MTVNTTQAADRDSLRAAVILGLCLPGDVLLYLLLPMQPEAFDITLAEAGLLLAANRLVRIVGYRPVMSAYARWGDRPSVMLAAGSAALCALGYATLSGFWALLLLRLVWGLCYAALNLSTQVMATAQAAGSARRSGRSRAVIAIGPMLALPLGALLSQAHGPRVIFLAMVASSLLAAWLARGLPAAGHPLAPAGRRLRSPDSVAIWSFIEGLTLDGLFIVGLSLLAQQLLGGNAVLVAGGLLALRYLSELVLSPLGGLAAQRWGATRMLIGFSLLTALALVAFGCHWLVLGGGLVLVLRALQLPLVVPVIAERNPGQQRLQALAANAVWRDIGAGVGPLLAALLLPLVASAWVYSLAALALAVSALACAQRRTALVGVTP
ncbi:MULTISPECIES: MFS transporter [Pseudomonas]|uniref:MFS transporter n=1 Tax=Pseudomonas TaxID=286 RepID=UPI001AE62401|nr:MULTISPECIES: MFS transporter [Pseudomonas]MBP2269481.1 MFS family permease [Pseudomonas sp. BP6]MBP2286237.1 MFS family permease [Pseudomonas sp. BP7]HDS1696648.1 MFS transporter [Pseudomonas putida]HDS1701747.1 MFS transporter [Pseudomonas putida]